MDQRSKVDVRRVGVDERTIRTQLTPDVFNTTPSIYIQSIGNA